MLHIMPDRNGELAILFGGVGDDLGACMSGTVDVERRWAHPTFPIYVISVVTVLELLP